MCVANFRIIATEFSGNEIYYLFIVKDEGKTDECLKKIPMCKGKGKGTTIPGQALRGPGGRGSRFGENRHMKP